MLAPATYTATEGSVSCELLRTCCWEEQRGITQLLKGRIAGVWRKRDMATYVLEVWVTISKKIHRIRKRRPLKAIYTQKDMYNLVISNLRKSWWCLGWSGYKHWASKLFLAVWGLQHLGKLYFMCLCVQQGWIREVLIFPIDSLLLEEGTIWVIVVDGSCCKLPFSSLAVWVSVCVWQLIHVRWRFKYYFQHPSSIGFEATVTCVHETWSVSYWVK